MAHRHQVKTSATYGYNGSVAQPENRAAHGGVVHVDTCSCGAVRKTNSNGRHVERSTWNGGAR